MSLLHTVRVLLAGDDPYRQGERPKREYSPAPVGLVDVDAGGDGQVDVRKHAPPATTATTSSTVGLVERPPRPDVVVGQSLAAAYDYCAANGWLDPPRPKVMSTAPHEGFGGRVLLVITDPPNLDPDLWRQLREHRDRLTCVVRP